MEMQRVKLLDDHIFVLRSMVETISQELSEALQERRQLLEILGMAERYPSSTEPYSATTHLKRLAVHSNEDGFCWTTEVSKLDLGDEMCGMCPGRSNSPTSPLNLHIEGIDVAGDYYSEPSDDVNLIRIDEANCHSEVHFSEDLPTPRGAACLEHTIAEEATPDMNNALSDSDDDETLRVNDSHSKQLNSVHRGDGAGKVKRPTSSLNNADSDSDLDEDPSTKPRNWISNTVFTSTVVSMMKPLHSEGGFEVDNRPCFEKMGHLASRFLSSSDNHTSVNLRSYDATLMERATATVRLSDDLKRLKVELLGKEAQIGFMQEKLYRYKEALKKEVHRRERETRELKTQKDQESSARFVLFCKLQATEARVGELEEKQRSLLGSAEAVSMSDTSDEEALSDGVVTMDVHAQRVARSRRQQSEAALLSANEESVEQNPLHDSLRETYAKLLEAEKRGDRLQRRIQKLEKKMSTQKTSSTLQANRNAKGTVAKSTKRTARNGVKEPRQVAPFQQRERLRVLVSAKTDLGMPRSRTGEKVSHSTSKTALRSKHERESSSNLPLSGTRPATRLSKPKRWYC